MSIELYTCFSQYNVLNYFPNGKLPKNVEIRRVFLTIRITRIGLSLLNYQCCCSKTFQFLLFIVGCKYILYDFFL